MLSYISSRHNSAVMLAASLSEKKNREKTRLFRFDGKKLFAEACACGVELEHVFLLESKKAELIQFVNEKISIHNINNMDCVYILSDAAFDKICEEKSPEGIITVAKYIDKHRKIATIDNMASAADAKELFGEGRMMAFESLRDPGNLGTVIRTAAALGVDTLLLSSDCADIYKPRTVRAAMGALFTRRIVIADDLPCALAAVRKTGRRTVAAALSDGARDVRELSLGSSDCVVIGNEGHGLSETALAACELSAILPMERGPGIESLNASVAAAIFMWLCRGEDTAARN